MGKLIIVAKDLEKTYPGKVPVHALRGVTFEMRRGEFVGLMGRSGSGKSTLLRTLGLLDLPTGGILTIDGTDVLALTPHQRTHERLERIGYIFQEFALLNEFTARQNVEIPLMARHDVPAEEVPARAAAMLAKVGLGDRLHHYPSELSGGEQQRVAVARALVNEPAILLADEPTANLDSDSATIVMELLVKLNRELGQTILMISHEEEDAKWCDRVIRLKDGLIERIETVRQKA